MIRDKKSEPLSEQHYNGNNKADELATRAIITKNTSWDKVYSQEIATNYTLQALLIRIIHDKTEREKAATADPQDNNNPTDTNQHHATTHAGKPTTRINQKTNL